MRTPDPLVTLTAILSAKLSEKEMECFSLMSENENLREDNYYDRQEKDDLRNRNSDLSDSLASWKDRALTAEQKVRELEQKVRNTLLVLPPMPQAVVTYMREVGEKTCLPIEKGGMGLSVDAIKGVREAGNVGLKEAKDYVETWKALKVRDGVVNPPILAQVETTASKVA